jgi:hypothetical protein
MKDTTPWKGFEKIPSRKLNYNTTGKALDEYDTFMTAYSSGNPGRANDLLNDANTVHNILQQCLVSYSRESNSRARASILEAFKSALTIAQEKKTLAKADPQKVLDNLMAHYIQGYNKGRTADTDKIEGLLSMGETLCEKANLDGKEKEWMGKQRTWERTEGKAFREQLAQKSMASQGQTPALSTQNKTKQKVHAPSTKGTSTIKDALAEEPRRKPKQQSKRRTHKRDSSDKASGRKTKVSPQTPKQGTQILFKDFQKYVTQNTPDYLRGKGRVGIWWEGFKADVKGIFFDNTKQIEEIKDFKELKAVERELNRNPNDRLVLFEIPDKIRPGIEHIASTRQQAERSSTRSSVVQGPPDRTPSIRSRQAGRNR